MWGWFLDQAWQAGAVDVGEADVDWERLAMDRE